MKRSIVNFPQRSAPIAVKGINLYQNKDSEALLAAIFNFDESATHAKTTYVAMFESVDRLMDLTRGNKHRNDTSRYFTKILERNGHWGFRSISCYQGSSGTRYISTVDRSEDMLYIIEIPQGLHTIKAENIHKIDLSYGTKSAEPIYSSFIPPQYETYTPLLLINQRGENDLTIVEKNNEGRYEIRGRIDVGGSSRSNIAVGHFRSKQYYDIALALWGGDPKDLNSVRHGQLVFILGDDTKKYDRVFTIAAGIHPTDVVAGDFDGDGLHEVAVLNYGSGLNTGDRIHPGGIQIFKYIGNEFTEVDSINVPHPRIGLCHDIDDDGKDELLVSLFFEKRVVTIKHQNG